MANNNNHGGSNHVGTTENEEGRQRIEGVLEDIIENLRRFTITIEEYSSESQSLIFEKMYECHTSSLHILLTSFLEKQKHTDKGI